MPLPSNPEMYGDLFLQFNILSNYGDVPSKKELTNLFPPINISTNNEDISAYVHMESLNNDDYYKFDVFEEENEYNDLFLDDCNESECNPDGLPVITQIQENENKDEDEDEEDDEGERQG